jgi:hypothetical protein
VIPECPGIPETKPHAKVRIGHEFLSGPVAEVVAGRRRFTADSRATDSAAEPRMAALPMRPTTRGRKRQRLYGDEPQSPDVGRAR